MNIHPTAIVDPNAEIDPSVEIGPYCIIEGHVRVAAGCRLMQNVYLTGWTSIAEGCVLHPGAVVGHEPQDTKYRGQRSYCRVGAHTILREYVTIHRGAVAESETVVGANGFLLAGCHIAHNCIVGDNVTIVNNVMLAGHVTVADRVVIGGGVAVHQFVRLGELSMVGGMAGLQMDVPPFAMVDRAGRVVGLNRVGLRRAEVPREEVAEIREVFRLLYDSGLSLQEACGRSAAIVKTESGNKLVEFLSAESSRGLAGRSRRDGTA